MRRKLTIGSDDGPFDDLQISTLTKAALISRLVCDDAMTTALAKSFVDAFFAEISQQLADGKNVKLVGFGTFQVRVKQARPGRNPRTGQVVRIDQRKIVTFASGPTQKQRLSLKRRGKKGVSRKKGIRSFLNPGLARPSELVSAPPGTALIGFTA